MIISRTPYRISFAGGGTDLGEFYRNNTFGSVVNTAIDKYIYITVSKRFDQSIRLSYTRTEIVDCAENIRHPIVRSALKLTGIDTGIEITSIADIPASTGLGSSSSFAVGLLNALYAYKGVYRSARQLAEEACSIEIDMLKEPIGKQDQYAAAYGGINCITFNSDESVFVEPLICSRELKEELNHNLIMFYTGITRSTSNILDEQKKNTSANAAALLSMRDMASEFKEIILSGKNLNYIGEMLDRSWKVKKGLAGKITNSEIDDCYDLALKNGALGGKILGAGGGGFLLFYCEKFNQGKLIEALKPLRHVPFKFEPHGSGIIFVD